MASRMAPLELSGLLYGVLNGMVRPRMALQPIIDLGTERTIGYEALFRVERHPELDPVALWREAFRTGVVDRLEDLVAETCRMLPRSQGRLFVNVDPRSRDIVSRWAPLGDAVLELNEIANIPDAVIRALDEAGIPYAVDDVGTGQANFAALVRMRPAYIKVDRSIVDGCHRDVRKATMLRMLARYAEEVGASLIAEGVELPGEARTLREIGVPYGQGFLFGRPILGKRGRGR